MLGLLKKPLSIANQVEGKFKMHFQQFIEYFGGPEERYGYCFADVML